MGGDFLKGLGEILRSGRPIEERLRESVGRIAAHLPGSNVSVLLYDRDTEEFYVRSTTLRTPPAQQPAQYASSGTIEGMAVREHRPVTLSEMHRIPGSRQRAESAYFPLVSSGEAIGVLTVQAVSDSGLLAERRDLLADAAALLSDAVGASLREESATLRMTKIAAINEAGINIISTLDLGRLLKLVATSACLIMEAQSCVIRLLDGESGKYGIREFYGAKAESERKELFRMDKAAVAAVLKGASHVLVRDAGDEDAWREFSGIARTLLSFPLKDNGEIIGTVTIFDKFPHKTFYPSSFNGDDVGTFEKFVRYAEKAVANAIAFERNDRLKNLDESTGLPTLRYFQERLLHEISRAKRFDRRLVLMICEVAPRIPAKAQGRGALTRSEWVIRRLARSMRRSLREYDILARISEGKFAMILPEAEDGKISAIPRIKRTIADDVAEIGKKLRGVSVDVRFGHASFPEDGDDHEKLIFKSNILKV